jgi:hypothetical protein
VPVLVAVSVQFHGWPTTAALLTLLAFVSVRSDTSAIAHSENELHSGQVDVVVRRVHDRPPCGVHTPPTALPQAQRDSVIAGSHASSGSR